MSDLSPISPRLHAIEARVAQLEQASRARNGNARLGFGLALQNAAIDAAVPSNAASTTTPAPGAATGAGAGAGAGPSVLSAPSVTIGGATSTGPAATGAGAPVSVDPATVDPAGARPELTPATVRSGSYGRLEPPAELLPHGNGRIPNSALTAVGDTGHRLYGPAAVALNTLMGDAATAGVTVGITDSYRSYDAQVDLARRKGLYSQGGLAATPGTSNHGWGLSTDLRLDDAALRWMRENAWRYGFVEDVPREPWHWTYRPDPS